MRKTTAKKRARLYMAARLLAGACVLALIAAGFFGGKTKISETPFETVRSAVTAAARLEETQEGDNQMLRRLFGLDPAEYEAYALIYPATNMGAAEMLLVKLKTPAQAEALSQAAEKRVETQIGVFEGYAPAQTALLKTHAVIEAQGNYFLYITDENAAAALAAFHEVL